MKSNGKLILGILLVLLASEVMAENFRGKPAAEINSTDERTIQFPIDSLISINTNDTNDLIQGIELNITIPPEIRRYRDSFMLYIFNSVSPAPSTGVTSYYGDRLLQLLLPSTSKLYIQVPVSSEHTLKPLQGTHIVGTVSPFDSFPIVLTILPVMKGIPPEVYSAELEISVKPIYFAETKINVSVIDNETGEDISIDSGMILIDNSRVTDLSSSITLRTGIHTISTDIPGYRPETKNISLQQGVSADIVIKLTRTVPTFSIEAPREAKVFIDGTLYDGIHGRIEEISPGTHTVLFKIGDYSISKKIEIKEGNNYTISLFFDIFIKED